MNPASKMIMHTTSVLRAFRSALLLVLLALLTPVMAAAQTTFSTGGVRLTPDGADERLEGAVDFKYRAACMGAKRIQLAVERVVIQGVHYEGRVYGEVPGYPLPREVSGGVIEVSGQLGNSRLGGVFPLTKANIGVRLGGFLDWLVAEDVPEDWGCQEWTAFVERAGREGAISLQIGREYSVGDGVRREMERAIAEADAAEAEAVRAAAQAEEERLAAAAATERAAQRAAQAEAESAGSTNRPPGSSGGATGAGGDASASGGSGSSSTQAPRLSRAEQGRYDAAIRLASRFEGAGNYTMAVRHYRSAYSITGEEWIARRIQALGSRQQAEAEEERERVRQGAEAMARGARAAGNLIDAFEDGLDDSALRIFAVEGILGYASADPSSGGTAAEEFTGHGFRIDTEAELNVWFRKWGGLLYNVGGAAGWNGTLYFPSEEHTGLGFRNQQSAYHYMIKAGVGGYFEVGHGARSYGASDNSAALFVDAKEGFLSYSLGNFRHKGGSWRFTYQTTSDLALLGGGDGMVDDETAFLSYWSRGSAMAWRAGMNVMNYDGADDRSYTSFFFSWGLAFR